MLAFIVFISPVMSPIWIETIVMISAMIAENSTTVSVEAITFGIRRLKCKKLTIGVNNIENNSDKKIGINMCCPKNKNATTIAIDTRIHAVFA